MLLQVLLLGQCHEIKLCSLKGMRSASVTKFPLNCSTHRLVEQREYCFGQKWDAIWLLWEHSMPIGSLGSTERKKNVGNHAKGVLLPEQIFGQSISDRTIVPTYPLRLYLGTTGVWCIGPLSCRIPLHCVEVGFTACCRCTVG